MLTTRNNRLDPSLIPQEQLAELAKVFAKSGPIALIDAQGNRADLPEALFTHFGRIVRLMSERKAVVLVPEEEAFTTQAAANYLGVSRQHLVDLLEQREMPHHKVGTHRRVTFKDLLAYERKRDTTRRTVLDQLAAAAESAGRYDSVDHGLEAGATWGD